MTPVVRGPEPGKTYVCPECDSSNQIYERASERGTPREGDERYACYDCTARFAEPDVRERRSDTGGSPAVGEEALAAMDPDDFPPGREVDQCR